MISTPKPPDPPTPPNPPMFGGAMMKGIADKTKTQAMNSAGFGGTILGQTNPTNTGQKTLLGQ
jgi:hypothetical protein